MSIISVVWLVGFYGWFLPNKIESDESSMREQLELVGLKPIEMIDVSGWSGTATWTISKLDSLGNPVEKKIDMRLVKGSYIVEPN